MLALLAACGGGGTSADAVATGTGSTAGGQVTALAVGVAAPAGGSTAAASVVAADTAWTACAEEGQTCAFVGTKQVRYGAGTAYVVQTLSGGTACSNAVFGDPVYGVVKSCAYADLDAAPAAPVDSSSWTLCAVEGGVCAYTGTRSVRYGTLTQYATAVLAGPVECSNVLFGDPAFGLGKSCWYGDVVDPDAANWVACAVEGGRCSFSGTRAVRYGSGTTRVVATFADGVDCTNAVFGDPTPGVAKACSYAAVAAVPALPARARYVGTNLGGLAYFGANFPFADLIKTGGGWGSRNDDGSTGQPFPSVAADGTPTALAPGQHAVTPVAWGGTHYPAGLYTVLWDGEGTLSFPSNSLLRIVERSANRVVLEAPIQGDANSQMWVSIDSTRTANPVRNVRFLWPGTEATYATQPFNPAFLEKIAPFSMLRFMDWAGTNGSSLKEWSDRAQVADLSYAAGRGVPIERMIDLANTLHVDPWFCVPHQASDDYVRQFAQLLHATLDPSLRPHIEYSNEVWNTAFPQTQWALSQSAALGLEAPYGLPSIYYAKRSVEIFELMRQVYGAADAPRLVRVIAGQAAWTQFLESALAYRDTASNADVMAIAPYFTAPSAADPGNAGSTLQLSASQLVDQMIANIRGPVRDWMQTNAALAARYGLPMKAYEGGAGDSLWALPQPQQGQVYSLFVAAHLSPHMADAYAEYYEQWIAAGGDALLQYNDVGAWSPYGLWGALQYVTQDPAASPKYQALLGTIARHPLTAATTATAARRAATGR